jgi:hypothetical protein
MASPAVDVAGLHPTSAKFFVDVSLTTSRARPSSGVCACVSRVAPSTSRLNHSFVASFVCVATSWSVARVASFRATSFVAVAVFHRSVTR